jgi:predicted RecA/RadA family phage recombinase
VAKNVIFETSDTESVTVTDPATPVSGDPVLFGDLPGLALTDESKGGNPTGKTTVKFRGVVDVSVKGVNGGGNSAVADGDVIYYVAADTPKLSKKTTGVRYGVAMGKPTDAAGATLAAAGATTTIRVRIGY